MTDETFLKAFFGLLAAIIVIVAFMLGHNGQLALIAVVLLFGGEKLLEKIPLTK